MSQNNQDQEIDLSVISNKISGLFYKIGQTAFELLQFVKKKIIIIGVLFLVGAVLGYFMDKDNNAYVSEIIVVPNFGSTDNLYSKIDLLQSKISENDTVFLAKNGFTDFEKIKGLEVEPIVDIYNFVNNNTAIANNAQNTQNFELVKLLSEDSDITKVIKDELTSKHYSYHNIKISSDGRVNEMKHIQPILNFLNNSEFYQNLRKTSIANIQIKMKENQVIIDQINGLLDQFGKTSSSNQKSDKLVYYNENNQLNDIINTKNMLVAELGQQRLQLINLDKVTKPNSIVLNQKNIKGLNGKMGKVLPILFLFLFFGFSFMMHFYKKFSIKYA